MGGVRHFEDFDCWQLANELKLEIYKLLERPHVKVDRAFCDQIRRAVASAPANIAEGFGRRSDTEFARFLDIARGSLSECRNHIIDAKDRTLIDEKERSELDSLASRAVGAVAGLQRYLAGGNESNADTLRLPWTVEPELDRRTRTEPLHRRTGPSDPGPDRRTSVPSHLRTVRSPNSVYP